MMIINFLAEGWLSSILATIQCQGKKWICIVSKMIDVNVEIVSLFKDGPNKLQQNYCLVLFGIVVVSNS
jgi:hypothetical protein